LLAAIRHDDLGSSLSLPSAFTVKNRQGELQWYLALGSGSDLDPKGMHSLASSQSARLFLLNLHTLQQDINTGKMQPIKLAAPGSYVGGISAADWNLDGASDALYVTTVGYQPSLAHSRWSGALFRVTTGLNGGQVEKLLALDAPLPYRPQLSIDPAKNRWIHLASGRLTQSDDYYFPARNHIVGLKEVRLSTGEFLMEGAKGIVSKSSLAVQELLNVSALQVDSQTGELHGPTNLSPALARSHVLDLEQRMMQYSDASAYQHGWHLALASNEVANAQGILYGGMFSQPTYQISAVSCETSGQAFVHNLRFTTGTAWFDVSAAHLTTNQSRQKPSPALANTKGGALSSAALAGYLMHVPTENSQAANILISDQQGSLKTQESSFLERLISGEVSWREL
jgi:hypothetical protein